LLNIHESNSFTNYEKILINKHVAIFGLGGVGSNVGNTLINSGIGNLTVVDSDYVESSNINRSASFLTSDIGKLKQKHLRIK